MKIIWILGIISAGFLILDEILKIIKKYKEKNQDLHN